MAAPKGKGKGTKFGVSIAIQARDLASRVVRGVAAGLKRSFDGVTKSVKVMVGRLRSLTDFGAKLGTVFATWGSWITSLGGKIKDVVVDTSDWGAKILHLSQSTGVATDTLQELAYAGSQVGVEQTALLKSVEVMTRKFGEMGAGAKGLYTFLSTVGGRALADQAKRAKTMDERLELMLVAMGKVTDEEKRLAFATQVFGEEGRNMVLLLAGGTDGFRKLRQEAHDYHQVMDRQAIEDTARFGDELDKVKKTWGGAKQIFGVEVIRALMPDIERLTRWLRENPDSVRKLARELGEGVATAVRGIRDGVAWIWDHRGEILTWAKTLAVVFGAGGLLGSIGGIVGGLRSIGGLASGANTGLLGGLLGGWKAGLVALAGGVVYMMGKAIAQLIPKERTPEQKVEDQRRRMTGGSFLNDGQWGYWSPERTLGGVLPDVSPNARALTDAEAKAALLYGRRPAGVPETYEQLNPQQRERFDAYSERMGFNRTFDALDTIRKVELEIKVSTPQGTTAEVAAPRLPADFEAKINRRVGVSPAGSGLP